MKDIFKEIDNLQNEINSFRPLNKHLLKLIKDYYRIGLTYSSNALEGNSLTESETKIVLEEGITIGGKPLKDHLEAIGHSDAYNYMLSIVKNNNISENEIRNLHKLIYYRINNDNAGIYRKNKAIITGSKFSLPKPDQLNSLMKKFSANIPKILNEKHPVEAAATIHKEFVFIHPFIDGNGRTARLLMNLVLLQKSYNIAIIPLIMRKEYIEYLEKAHESDRDFINFIARMLRETQKDYLRLFFK
jgi:Fic family protein